MSTATADRLRCILAPSFGGDRDLGTGQGELDVSADGRFVVFVSGEALPPGAAAGSLAVDRAENPPWTP